MDPWELIWESERLADEAVETALDAESPLDLIEALRMLDKARRIFEDALVLMESGSEYDPVDLLSELLDEGEYEEAEALVESFLLG
ncbi:hypothetical protein [Methanopyrus kandleri]